MNEENLNYLKENLKYLGFGEKLYANLEHHIQQGFPEFILKTGTQFGSSKLESILYFSKSKESGRYFFNRHDAKLTNESGTREQSFYINKGHGVTLKEAFNLLEGRAVYKEINPKEGETYHAWIQLDFRNQMVNGNYRLNQFHDHYCYDLAGVLFKLPVKELLDPRNSERLLMSLRKGNLHPVTMLINGKEQKFSIHANPQFKTIDIYDYGSPGPLTTEQKVQLISAAGMKKINGKEVDMDKEGKELKQDNDKGQKSGLKNSEASQKKRKAKSNAVKLN